MNFIGFDIKSLSIICDLASVDYSRIVEYGGREEGRGVVLIAVSLVLIPQDEMKEIDAIKED